MLNVSLAAAPSIGSPFLLIIKLLDPKVPLASTITTSSPVEGDAGSVIVIGFVVVFAKICSPADVVYAVTVAELIVIYPLSCIPRLMFVPSEYTNTVAPEGTSTPVPDTVLTVKVFTVPELSLVVASSSIVTGKH